MNTRSLYSAIILVAFCCTCATSFAQNVGISNATFTPDAQALLELQSTEKGVLLPRMTTAQATTLAASLDAGDDGMTVYDTDTKQYKYWNGTSLTWNVLATSASVTGSTLDDAYDAGGAGTGRSITADAGSVQIIGTGGAVGLETDGDIQLSTDDTWIGAGATLERIEFDQSLDRIDVEGADLTLDSDKWVGIDGSSPRIEFEDGTGRVNVQDADIEVDDDAWIGLNASNPRIEFDNANDRLDMRAADIEMDAGKWIGIGSTVERIVLEGTDDEINILGATGGVGINTDSPNAILEVQDAGSTDPFTVRITKNTNNANELVGIGLGAQSGQHYAKSGIVHERESANGTGKLHFLVDDAVDINDVALTEARMTIDRNGLVGIGTTAPAEELHVVGDIRSSVLSGGGNVQADANGNLIVSNDLPGNDDSYIHNQTAAYQTADFQISGDGELDGGLTVGAGMTIDDNNTNTGSIANGSIAFGNGSGEGIGSKRSAGGNQYGLDFYTNSINRLAIAQGGNVGVGTSAPDEKLDVRGIIKSQGTYRVDIDGNNGAGPRIALGSTGNPYDFMNLGAYAGINNLETTTRDFRIGSNAAFNAFYLEESNGFIGLGTNAPAAQLDVNGNIHLGSSTGNKQIYTWSAADANWRIGMSSSPGFTRAMLTDHVQYMTYAPGTAQGFSVGVNGGNSSFEVRGSDHQAYHRGNVGIGTTGPIHALDVNGRIHVNSGVIQRGGAAITGTSDLGMYQRTAGNWMRFVTNAAPIRFFSDDNTGTSVNVSIEADGTLQARQGLRTYKSYTYRTFRITGGTADNYIGNFDLCALAEVYFDTYDGWDDDARLMCQIYSWPEITNYGNTNTTRNVSWTDDYANRPEWWLYMRCQQDGADVSQCSSICVNFD